MNNFFEEWNDNKKIFLTLSPSLTALMWVFLMAVYVNLSTPLDKFAMIFASFLLIGIVVGGLDFLNERNPLFAFIYAGKNWGALFTALVAGLVGAVLFTGGKVASVFFPSFAVTSVTSEPLFLGLSAGFVFTVLIAPYAEEKFFRMTLMPTLHTWLKNFRFLVLSSSFVSGAVAALMTSLIFGLYHWGAYGGNIVYLQGAVLFSLIAIMGNYAFKSVFFGVGLHLGNNFIAYGGVR